jgi:hypothetical protein
MIIGDEVVIAQEEEVALNAIKRVILPANALMGMVGLHRETTDATMIMIAIEGTILQGIQAIGIARSHVLTHLNVRIPAKRANQFLAHVQDLLNVALKRKVFRDLTPQNTTGRLMIVAVTVEVKALSRTQVEVVAEVKVATEKGL